jgi:uncharacterized protein with FMN-binding domain
MRRAPLVLAATVAGVAGVLQFHPSGTPAGSPGKPATAPSTVSGKRIDGDVVATQYGDVQVQITVKAGKLVDVSAPTLPQGDGRSSEISNFAAPLLRAEVLQAQSGQVDAVSGATYTSEGYASSAASAIQKAGLTASNAVNSG